MGFFNRLSVFLERESHQQKDFPMEKDSEQLQIDQQRKLCCLFHQQNQTQPMLWMILIFKYFSLLFCSLSTSDGSDLGLFSVLSTEGNKGTVSLLVSIKSDTVFGSVDEISNIVSAAGLSVAVLNLFPWESLFVGDFLFLERRLIY